MKKVAELQCFRGTCILENEFDAKVLRDDEKSVITLVAAPVEPVVMTIEEPTEFEELPEAQTGEIAIPTPEPTPQLTPTPGPRGANRGPKCGPQPGPERFRRARFRPRPSAKPRSSP